MANIGIRPIGPRIAVQIMSVKNTVRDSGIELVQTDNTDTYKADVIVVGDVDHIKEGDMVLLTIGAIQGAIFEYNQSSYAIVFEQDVLAILDRE